jgi:hypothetical protein
MLRIKAVLIAGALATGGGLAGVVSVAASTVVSGCGTAITTPGTYVLGADLDCSLSSSNGVDIESSNVTLNLKGYSINGGTGANDYNGVSVGSGGELNHVTVENGTIENWAVDLFPEEVSNFTASKLTLTVDGIESYEGFEGTAIDKGSVSAVNLSGSASIGFYINDSANLKVSASSADGGEYGFYGQYNDKDSYVNDTANTNAADGFYEDDSNAITFSQNQANDNPTGIYDYCDYDGAVTLEHNTADDNDYGIDLYECSGESKKGYIDSLIKSNVAEDNFDNGFTDYYSFGASYISNVAEYNDGYGMILEYPADYTVTSNVTSDNAGTGIYLEKNGAYDNVVSASKNQANDNGDYGLYADYAAPGSANVAHDDFPDDCFNFVCS